MINKFRMIRKITLVLFIITFVVALVVFLFSWRTVQPGYEGFVYTSDGTLDTEKIYKEGTYFIAPWNELILYDVLEKSPVRGKLQSFIWY